MPALYTSAYNTEVTSEIPSLANHVPREYSSHDFANRKRTFAFFKRYENGNNFVETHPIFLFSFNTQKNNRGIIEENNMCEPTKIFEYKNM